MPAHTRAVQAEHADAAVLPEDEEPDEELAVRLGMFPKRGRPEEGGRVYPVGDGADRSRYPIQEEQDAQPQRHLVPGRSAEAAAYNGGRRARVRVPEHDSVRAVPRGGRERGDVVRVLHGQDHRQREGRGAATLVRDHTERARKRQSRGQLVQLPVEGCQPRSREQPRNSASEGGGVLREAAAAVDGLRQA